MTNLSLGACVGTMKAIAKGAVTHEIDALGITEGDYKLVTSPSQWVATDRTRVRGVLDALAYETKTVSTAAMYSAGNGNLGTPIRSHVP